MIDRFDYFVFDQYGTYDVVDILLIYNNVATPEELVLDEDFRLPSIDTVQRYLT